MAKIIEHPKLKEHRRNLKALKVLIDQYLKDEKTEAIRKVKREQEAKPNGSNAWNERLQADW